jgi:hypothetical protein
MANHEQALINGFTNVMSGPDRTKAVFVVNLDWTIQLVDQYRFSREYRIVLSGNDEVRDFRRGEVVDETVAIERMHRVIMVLGQAAANDGHSLLHVTLYFKSRKRIDVGEVFTMKRTVRVSDVALLSQFKDYIRLLETTDAGHGYTVVGSGVFDEYGRMLIDPFLFEVYFNKMNVGNGKGGFKVDLFDRVVLDDYVDGYCGLACLQLVCDVTKEIYDELKLKQLDNLVKYINDEELPINVIGNFVSVNAKRAKFDMVNYTTLVTRKYNVIFNKLLLKNIDLKIYTPSFIDDYHTIIYDINARHYEITEKLSLNNLYIDLSYVLYNKVTVGAEEAVAGGGGVDKDTGEGYIINRIDTIKKSNDDAIKYDFKKPVFILDRYLFFDYETVEDNQSKYINKPYSVGVLDCTLNDLYLLNKMELTYGNVLKFDKNVSLDMLTVLYDQVVKVKNNDDDEKLIIKIKILSKLDILYELLRFFSGDAFDVNDDKKIKVVNDIKQGMVGEDTVVVLLLIELKNLVFTQFCKFKSNMTHVFIGFDCTKQLIDYIQLNQDNVVYHLIGFNSAKFDNHIFYKDCIDLKIERIEDFVLTNGSILNFKLFSRHRPLDMCKFITGGLLDNCENYGIELCKKVDGFDHAVMKNKYHAGSLIKDIKDSKEFYEYQTQDCMALAVIFVRFRLAINSIPCFKSLVLESFMTLGQLTMSALKTHVKKNKVELPNFYVKKRLTGVSVKKQLEIDNLNKRLAEYYIDISENRVAGRVQLFNGIQKIIDNIVSLDVCSLYPYIMLIAPNYFPTGEIVEVKTYDEKPKDLIGFFYCSSIDQTGMTINGDNNDALDALDALVTLVPRKTNTENDWTVLKINNNKNIKELNIEEIKGEKNKDKDKNKNKEKNKEKNKKKDKEAAKEENKEKNKDEHKEKNKEEEDKEKNTDKIKKLMLSSIMIERIRLAGGKVTTENGIYFTTKVFGVKIFGFLVDVMKMKNQQDLYKNEKDYRYNSSFRDIFKLVLNIPSGKVNERLKTDKKEVMSSSEYATKFYLDKHNVVSFGSCLAKVGVDKFLVSYDKHPEDCLQNAAPVYVGSLIYDYAKIYMYDHMYSKFKYKDLIYTDTDSNKIRRTHFLEWVAKYGSKTIVPHILEAESWDVRFKNHVLFDPNSKVFGSFVDEYVGDRNNLSYYVAKKIYLTCYDKTYDDIKGSGIIFVSEREKDKVINKTLHAHIKGIGANSILVNNINLLNSEDNIKVLSEMYSSKKYTKIKDNYITVFENLFKTKSLQVVTFNMIRACNNVGKISNDNKICFNIVSSYLVKTITL